MSERTYDLIVFGATGFTGRLVSLYLADRLRGTDVKWAIAGRQRSKLERVLVGVQGVDPAASAGLVEASSDDPASLLAMARSTRVVLTTVGPYARYGTPLVEACIEAGSDCVDITGEPEFVNGLIERCDERARARGVRIVNCCGFDSVPHDLGAWFVVQKLGASEPIELSGVVRAKGGVSGGTWHSAINAMANPRGALQKPAGPRREGRRAGGLRRGLHRDPRGGAWLVPLPTIDPAIVLRSARGSEAYGPDFRYGHFAQVRSTFVLAAGALGLGGVMLLAQWGPTRRLLLNAKQPGEGPSEAVRKAGWFEVTFFAKTPTRRLVARVSGGEPGYTETAKMVAESALCLVQDRERLPSRTGILTPALAFEDRLVERLVERGMRFEVIESA